MATDYTVDNIVDTVADFIEMLGLGECQQAQADRVPMPLGAFNIITPLKFRRLGTTRDIKADTGSALTSQMSYTEIRQAEIQVDLYGPEAGNRAIELETLFASSYGYETIKTLDDRLAPLYSSEAIQAPMINAESQWQERYIITLYLQAHITVTLRQDYFDRADITLEQVDNK